jgi:hypothetical protein
MESNSILLKKLGIEQTMTSSSKRALDIKCPKHGPSPAHRCKPYPAMALALAVARSGWLSPGSSRSGGARCGPAQPGVATWPDSRPAVSAVIRLKRGAIGIGCPRACHAASW